MDSLEPMSSMPSSSASPGISSDNYEDLNSADSEFQFPWKQREILTFDIPVHDSERAGLGVSVKGKTSTNKGKHQSWMEFRNALGKIAIGKLLHLEKVCF